VRKLLFYLSASTSFLFLLCPAIPAYGYDQTTAPVKISGTYGASAAIDTQNFLWKDANGDYQEKNWRYISDDFDVNTYDKRIFDRYQLEIETDTGTPFDAFAEIKIDPWTFVGVGEETVFDRRGDFATIKYKYWSNTGKTINETYRTYTGNFINVPEMKVIKNRVKQNNVRSGFMSWGDPFTTILSSDASVKIDRLFKPVRKLWVEYNNEPVYVKVFPIADQAEALTSDDPLKLSNNHVYWAPSPWLFSFNPGMRLAANQIDPAKWDWDLAWFSEDSNRNYLTFLRGVTVGYKLEDIAEITVTGATPMSLWDYYDYADSIPLAARAKIHASDRMTFGATYTSRYGINKKVIKSTNYVTGFDLNYALWDKTDIFGEYAVSQDMIEHADIRRQRSSGQAWKAGVKSKLDIGGHNKVEWDLSLTSMGRDFYPGLSDYKDTRADREWGRHIWFDSLSHEDRAIRIGNSIDVNRYVLGMSARVNTMEDLFDLYFNFRNAHEASTGKFIESILRTEATYNPLPNLQLKGLGLYRMYPPALGGRDPLIRDRYTDDRIVNAAIIDGKNADVATLSGGAKLDFMDKKISIYGIYEATNDPQDYPRGILNDKTDAREDGARYGESDILFNRLVPFLYSQDLFDFPPYRFYSIIKGVVTAKPIDSVMLKYTHVTNGNKNYAALFDDNHNHDAIEVHLGPLKNIDFWFGYSLSRVIDLERAISTNGVDRPFKPHHNVFAQLNWKLKNQQMLTFMYGESWIQNETPSVYSTRWPSTRVSVLDTRHILRLFFQGKF